jgi:hypothetical protein
LPRRRRNQAPAAPGAWHTGEPDLKIGQKRFLDANRNAGEKRLSLISDSKQDISDIRHQAAPDPMRPLRKANIMTSFKFARFALPALTAALIGFGAQAAVAQTSAAPSTMSQGSTSQGSMSQGSMSGMSMATPTTAKKKHHVAGHVLPASEKFSSVASAQAHCAGGAVVWVNTGHSRLFHNASSKYFGKTKHGAYVCEKSALAAGYHAAKH